MNIKTLLDLTCLTVANMIKGTLRQPSRIPALAPILLNARRVSPLRFQ